ncbi:MAG: hypothetical protein RIC53_19230, partial [Cyclobacteriaceae bacterium]
EKLDSPAFSQFVIPVSESQLPTPQTHQPPGKSESLSISKLPPIHDNAQLKSVGRTFVNIGNVSFPTNLGK